MAKVLVLIMAFVFGIQHSAAQVVTTETITNDDASLIHELTDSAKNKKWLVLTGVLILLIISLFNRLLKFRIPAWLLPWLSVVLGALSQTALYWSAGKPLLDGVLAGVIAGLLGAGTYSAAGRHVPGVKSSNKGV